MKQFLLLLCLLVSMAAGAKTLRVNNNAGSTAPYTSVEDALNDAENGDVILVDGSDMSYGTITITKSITLRGPGYYLVENGITSEDGSMAMFDRIEIRAENVKVSGISTENTNGPEIAVYAPNAIITRNYVTQVTIKNKMDGTPIANTLIHQNRIGNIVGGINNQITNNIIAWGDKCVRYMSNSVIARNTFASYEDWKWSLENCVIEYNIGVGMDKEAVNMYNDNYAIDYETGSKYARTKTDKDVRDLDQTLTTEHGAFSGEDPYVLSGLNAGPVITGIDMPESVVQGHDLKVTVTLSTSR